MTFVAGEPLISKSEAFTPKTVSLKVTSICPSEAIIAPPLGNNCVMTGGTVST